MKISIIGPGIMPIPPIGWGAVESLIWDLKNSLEKFGNQVQIINTQNTVEIIENINHFRPDFVHIHYDDFISIYDYIQYPKAITSHYGSIERPEMFGGYVKIINQFKIVKPNIFCLSKGIQKIYNVLVDIPKNNLYLTPNGVCRSNFKISSNPKFFDRSLYLAKIDYRKRQHLFQSIDSLWYAGNIADNRFNKSKNYLGEWTKDKLYNSLTDYGNLVLLSDGEAHSLVVMEALASGLGVVLSEYATANLDTSKKFITVIPENKINNNEFIEKLIIENREYSINHREEILEYSKEFDWENVVKEYYLPCVKKIVEDSK